MAAKKKKKAKEKIKKRDLDLLLALLGFFAFISIVFLASTFYSSNRIYSGIYIAGIDVSGKTKEEAREKMDLLVEQWIKGYIKKQNQLIGRKAI